MSAAAPVMMTLGQAHEWVPGSRLVGDAATPVARVHTDTRTLVAGDLFVALKGERFDANEFLSQAKASGAVAAIAHGGLEAAGLAGLEVPDSLAALGALARGWRSQFDLPLVAVTGSNGKTTVTQMVATILIAACADRALATAGNFNNEIGVPLTLLRLRSRHMRAVVELGMNHPGEIARLGAIAQPTIALVNNAQREHQEFFDGPEGSAHENASVFGGLSAQGLAVFPADDGCVAIFRHAAQQAGCKTLSFALKPAAADAALMQAQGQSVAPVDADLTGSADPHELGSQITIRLPDGSYAMTLLRAFGQHNVRNALAAASCAYAAGVRGQDIAAGLARFVAVRGRLQRGVAASGAVLIDDSYNANPDSVLAAIDVLAACAQPAVLVLGDMGEVGDRGAQFHDEVGRYARSRGITRLIGHGELMRHAVAAFGDGAEHAADIDAVIASARTQSVPGATILVKGSRFMRMERVVKALSDQVLESTLGAPVAAAAVSNAASMPAVQTTPSSTSSASLSDAAPAESAVVADLCSDFGQTMSSAANALNPATSPAPAAAQAS